eukprot:gene19690-25610_t
MAVSRIAFSCGIAVLLISSAPASAENAVRASGSVPAIGSALSGDRVLPKLKKRRNLLDDPSVPTTVGAPTTAGPGVYVVGVLIVTVAGGAVIAVVASKWQSVPLCTLFRNNFVVRSFGHILRRLQRKAPLSKFPEEPKMDLLSQFIRRLRIYRPRNYHLGGHRIRLPVGHRLDWHRLRHQSFDEPIKELADLLVSKYHSPHMIDIGANIGDTAALMVRTPNVSVLCIEGNDAFLPLLRQNLATVSDTSEIEASYVGVSEGAVRGSMRTLHGTAGLVEGAGTVAMRSLSGILDDHPQFRNSRLIKIDTDGFDAKIILASTEVLREMRPIVHVEYSPSGEPENMIECRKMISALKECGYKFFHIFDNFGNHMLRLSSSEIEKFDSLNSYVKATRENLRPSIFYYDTARDYTITTENSSISSKFNWYRRTALNTVANGVGIALNLSVQLISVAVLATQWGVDKYGTWLLFTTIPTYLALTDLGFFQAATNDIAIQVGAGDQNAALRTFHSITALFAVTCSIVISVASICALMLYYGIVQSPTWTRVPLAAFRGTGNYARGSLLFDTCGFLEVCSMLVSVLCGAGFIGAITTSIAIRILILIIYNILLVKTVPWITLGVKNASSADIGRLFYPAVGALGLPAALTINLQGTLLIIGALISPAAVAIFGTVRTATRIVVQVSAVVNRATMPEVSKSIGSQSNESLKKIIGINILVISLILIPGGIFFSLTGVALVKLWSNGHIVPSIEFVALMSVAMVIHGIWYMISNLILAANEHLAMTAKLLLASAGSVGFVAVGCRLAGLNGAAFGLGIGEFSSFAPSRDSGLMFEESLDSSGVADTRRTLRWNDRASLAAHFVALVFFALPLGLGNAVAQPIAMILLLPFLLRARAGWMPGILIAVGVATVSLIRASSDAGLAHSPWQFVRSGVPFIYLIILLTGYRSIRDRLAKMMRAHPVAWSSTLNWAIYLFAIGQALQVTFFSLGIKLANAALSSEDTGRVFLVQVTSTLLLLLYACRVGKKTLAFLFAFVLLATGSKTVILSMTIMVIIGVAKRSSARVIASNILVITTLAALATIANPVAAQRLQDFLGGNNIVDLTREWEIYHAKKTFNSSVGAQLFGVGLGVPLTPGVATKDPRWYENSRYDIENGYWAILAKIGIFGSSLILLMFASLPKNIVTFGLLMIEIIWNLSSGSLFFATFDGPYLVAWAVIIDILLILARSRQTVGANESGGSHHLETIAQPASLAS